MGKGAGVGGRWWSRSERAAGGGVCKGQGVGNVARGKGWKGARGGDRGNGGAVDRVARYHSRKVARRLQGSPACRWWSVRWQGCKSAARSPASNVIFFPLITFGVVGRIYTLGKGLKPLHPKSSHHTPTKFFRLSSSEILPPFRINPYRNLSLYTI